ncbi:uncharacterized protein MONBRDRAFT_20747, partial [Monosiga brevicollis MX1]
MRNPSRSTRNARWEAISTLISSLLGASASGTSLCLSTDTSKMKAKCLRCLPVPWLKYAAWVDWNAQCASCSFVRYVLGMCWNIICLTFPTCFAPVLRAPSLVVLVYLVLCHTSMCFVGCDFFFAKHWVCAAACPNLPQIHVHIS